MTKVLNQIIKYRYILAILVFVLGVSLNLNGSSIASWNRMGVTELQNGTQSQSKIEDDGSSWISLSNSDGVIMGIPRGIRSDEWMVQTPYFISQMTTKRKLVNPTYGTSGMNMIVAYNAPVNHISIIGKPFNWGALFLSPSRALSWYWCFKVVTFILLAFEFAMILTKGNKGLSFVASIVITYIPAVQWWFMQHLGDVVWYSLLAIVTIFHYFHSRKTGAKLVFAALLSISLIGFILVIYPAFQVVFAYIILAYFLVTFVQTLKQKVLTKRDWFIMSGTVLMTGGILGLSLYQSMDGLLGSLQTVYPGSRLSQGGEESLGVFVTTFLNFLLPFQTPAMLNQVELSSSVNFFPFLLLTLPLVIKKDKVRENWFGLFLTGYSLFLLLFTMVGVPAWFSKITLFSYVTSSRSWQAFAVIAVFVSIWYVNLVWQMEWKKVLRQVLPVSLIGFSALGLLVVATTSYQTYQARSMTLFLAVLVYLVFVFALLRLKKLFAVGFLAMALWTGFTVNPLVQGLGVVEDKSLTVAIKKIVAEDGDALWMTDNNMLYNYPQMFGAKMLNGVRFYPDKSEMTQLDPSHRYEQQWNRYSHIKPTITANQDTMSNSAPDILDMQMSLASLNRMGIRYVLSSRDLQAEFGDSFRLVYGPDKDGNRIYRYTASE